MRNKWLITAAAVAAFAAYTTTVKAVFIDGVVNVVGTVQYTPDNGHLGQATAATLWLNDYVFNAASGDFDTTFGLDFPHVITMSGTPWTFTPPTVKNHLIGIAVTGGTIYYNLLTSSVTQQSDDTLAIHTTGTILAPGFDPTAGVFNFTSQGPPAPDGQAWDYTWSGALGSVNRFQVPDGGTTVLLLGSAFLAIGLLRKKLSA